MSTSHATPSLLIRRIRDLSDVSAWQHFCGCYRPLVYGYCRRHGLQEADACDVTQEVFASVARAIGRFAYDRARGTFRGWLLTVTRSKLNNFLDRCRRRPQVTYADLEDRVRRNDIDGLEEREEVQQRQNLLDRAVSRICDEFQATTWEAFRLVTLEGLAAREVSRRVGISVDAVYIAKCRVLKRLRREVRRLSLEPEGA